MAGIRAVSKPKEKKIRCSIDRCTNSYVKQHGVKAMPNWPYCITSKHGVSDYPNRDAAVKECESRPHCQCY